MSSEVKSFGDVLREARLAAGLSQSKAGVKAGHDGLWWYNVERGWYNPSRQYVKFHQTLTGLARIGIDPRDGEVQKVGAKYNKEREKLNLIAAAVGKTVDDLLPDCK